MAKATSVKSSSDRKKLPLNCGLSHLDNSTNTCRWPSFLAILSAILNARMLSVCCISSKISYSCTMQGRGIPGLRIVLRQFILTHVVNFWPKYWFITWVNPSGEYSLLGSDSLFGSEQRYYNPNFEKWKNVKSVLVPMLRQEKLTDYFTASRIQLNHSFSVNHYFSFRIKQELPIVCSYKFICIYIISFYANITKIGIRSYHCRFTQSKPDKECHFTV